MLSNLVKGEPNIDDHVWLMSPEAKSTGGSGVLNATDEAYLPPACQAPGPITAGNDPYDNSKTPDRIKPCVYAMLNLIDVRFAHYEDTLIGTNSTITSFADLSVIGMGAAGGLVGGTTAQILSAASGAVTGSLGKLDSDILYNKTVDIILQQMKTARAAQELVIEAKLHAADANGYTSMYDAARDLYKYARAGSWTEALIGVQASVGAQSQACAAQQNTVQIDNAKGETSAGSANTSGPVTATSQCPSGSNVTKTSNVQ